MKFLLNNREEELTGENMSISTMMALKKYTFKMRIVKLNGILIEKDKYDSTIIQEGDNVQMLYLMSGG
jgi:thiamine biosynthesis protein ThiS